MTSYMKAKSITDMREIAARICRDYLTGAWKTITAEDITLKRISGGLSNFLYYVSLPDKYDTKDISPSQLDNNTSVKRVRKDSGQSNMEPKEVLLRIYGQTHGEHALETMVTESVVFTLLSERNLGPKLHGIFPGGRIEQFIPARPLGTSELSDYKISMKVAEKMAEIHMLDIPVSKEPDWLWNTMYRWLKTVDTVLNDVESDSDKVKDLYKEIRGMEFKKELCWLKSIIENGDYPVVFCHNDLQEGNILIKQETTRFNSIDDLSNVFEDSASMENHFHDVITSSKENDKAALNCFNGNSRISRKRSLLTEDNFCDLENTRDSLLSNSSEECDPDLIIIDYEYCAYNYRGFDLANHFIEWTIDYTNDKYPYYYHKKNQYPTKIQIDAFISIYLKKFSGNDNYTASREEMNELTDEIKCFTMASHLFWCLWSIVNVHQEIEFGYWEYAVSRLREYKSAKNRFCTENVIGRK